MENSIMTSRGIVIEKFTVGWLQLLTAVFAIGGFVVTSGYTYDKAVKVEAVQQAALHKYVPIIERLDSNYTSLASILPDLQTSITQLNNTLLTIQAYREKENGEKSKLENKVDNLEKEVIHLKVRLGVEK